MATGYNLTHLQVAPKTATPTYVDVNLAQMAEFGIDQDNDTIRADGGAKVTAYGAREGTGSIGFASANLATIAVMTGDTFSTTGTGATVINRLEIKGATVPPSLVLVAYIPNVDGNQTSAGMRITVPNGTLAVPSTSFEQEAWTEFEADLSYVANAADVMLIWEVLNTAPVFTGGVIPTNITAPA